MIKDPLIIYEEFFARESFEAFDYFDRYIQHECRINTLSAILHNYGRDVYGSVKRFM
jgi:hypothetical protein